MPRMRKKQEPKMTPAFQPEWQCWNLKGPREQHPTSLLIQDQWAEKKREGEGRREAGLRQMEIKIPLLLLMKTSLENTA